MSSEYCDHDDMKQFSLVAVASWESSSFMLKATCMKLVEGEGWFASAIGVPSFRQSPLSELFVI